jgi:hypothetical protein
VLAQPTSPPEPNKAVVNVFTFTSPTNYMSFDNVGANLYSKVGKRTSIRKCGGPRKEHVVVRLKDPFYSVDCPKKRPSRLTWPTLTRLLRRRTAGSSSARPRLSLAPGPLRSRPNTSRSSFCLRTWRTSSLNGKRRVVLATRWLTACASLLWLLLLRLRCLGCSWIELVAALVERDCRRLGLGGRHYSSLSHFCRSSERCCRGFL